jgi:hypothetical protein
MVIAACIALVLAPVSVAASTGNLVSIVDPANHSYAAHVTANGNLAVTQRDPVTGSAARVDGGSLRVGGTVRVGNLPSTQQVAGVVNVGNLPTTQQVAGTVTAVPGLPGAPYSQIATANQSPFYSFRVPSQYLTVETLTVEAAVTVGDEIEEYVYCYLNNKLDGTIFIPLHFTETRGGMDHFDAVEDVHMYCEPGSTFVVATETPNAGATTYAWNFGLSGYLT